MNRIFLFISMFIIWLCLTWPFSPVRWTDIITGIIVALVVVLFFGKKTKYDKRYLEIHRYLWAVFYIPVLVYYMILANFDVLYRILHPDVPIRPGIVKIKIGLKNKVARAVLANSITLTPGTLTIDIIDDVMYIHWINITSRNISGSTKRITEKFENILKKVFE